MGLLRWYIPKGETVMPFDYKKDYKEFYMPPKKPVIVTVPPMNYIAVRGEGDPNTVDGEYKRSIELLYGVAFTIKMSKKAPTISTATLTMLYLRWKAYGVRTE